MKSLQPDFEEGKSEERLNKYIKKIRQKKQPAVLSKVSNKQFSFLNRLQIDKNKYSIKHLLSSFMLIQFCQLLLQILPLLAVLFFENHPLIKTLLLVLRSLSII